jgi:predicted transcriptional regulator
VSEDSRVPEEQFTLPDDLAESVRELARLMDSSPRKIVIAAVEHFVRIPDQQKRAVLRGTGIRRGW